MPYKTLKVDNLKTTYINSGGGFVGVGSDVAPAHTLDVSGDLFANRYFFGQTNLNFATGISIDFNGPIVQTISITGSSLSITGVFNNSLVANELKATTVRLINNYSSGSTALYFSNDFRFLGGVPTGLRSGKMGVISFNSFGTGPNDTVCVYRGEGQENDIHGVPDESVLFMKDGSISGHNRLAWDQTKLKISGHVAPQKDGFFDLGSTGSGWNDLHLGGSIYLDSRTVKVNGVGVFEFSTGLHISGHVTPALSGAFDLGTDELRWRDLYLEGNSIHLGSKIISVDVSGRLRYDNLYIVTGSSPIASGIGGGLSGATGISITGAIGSGAGDYGGYSGVVFQFSNGSLSNVVELPIGPSGAPGPSGLAGPSGLQGPSGAFGGPAGPTGPIGLSGISITGAIGSGVGVYGGYSGVVFQFSNGDISKSVELPMGPSGAQGLIGPTGPSGAFGGPVGPTGPTGPAGAGGGGGDSARKVIYQSNSFTPGSAIRFDKLELLYVRSIASSGPSAEVLGIVESGSATEFTMVTDGYISNLIGVSGRYPSVGLGLAPGEVYFLSDLVSGLMQTGDVTGHNSISKPIFYSIGSGSGFVQNHRGLIISTGSIGGGGGCDETFYNLCDEVTVVLMSASFL